MPHHASQCRCASSSRGAAELSRRSQRKPAFNGFTLVELLVVITIIGILTSLLLPAVHSARERARKTQCATNINQLALACLVHEQNLSNLPTGGWVWWWAGDPDQGFGLRQPGGWIYNLLPFLDQRPLHDLGTGQAKTQKAVSLATAAQTPLAGLICPSRRPVMAYPNNPNLSYLCNANPISKAAHTDYAANTGTLAPTWWIAPNTGDPSFANAPGYKFPTFAFDGVINCVANVKLEQITDGVANTYLLGEKYMCPDDYFSGTEGCDNNSCFAGFDWDWQRWNGSPQQDTPGSSAFYSFGSAHPDGFNMAFCDGSVRSISFAIDPETHRRLCCRNDGMPVDNSKY